MNSPFDRALEGRWSSALHQFLIALFLGSITPPNFGQPTNKQNVLRGHLVDDAGAALCMASVALRNLSSSLKRSVVVDAVAGGDDALTPAKYLLSIPQGRCGGNNSAANTANQETIAI
jgi:hypothetical protein